MDKHEYKLRTEQMLELMEDGEYRKAADIADSIDWRRVRNTTMLTNVSEIYDNTEEYEKSYHVLGIIYQRGEGSRNVLRRLCSLALKLGNVDEAVDYYDEFREIAPKDSGVHLLRYQILKAQGGALERQIEALEEFKKSEYIEKWAYELAKLYQEAGMTEECVEECDDLILWFSEGHYVYKALELKMKLQPLTPSQQEKYEHCLAEYASDTAEIPNIEFYAARKAKREQERTDEAAGGREEDTEEESDSEGENDSEDGRVHLTVSAGEDGEMPRKRKLGSTMRLDDALRALLNPRKKLDTEEPDITDLEGAIEEIESVADLEIEKFVDEASSPDGEEEGESVVWETVHSDVDDILSSWDESEKEDSKLPASEETEPEEPKAEEKEPEKEDSRLPASEETEPEEPKAVEMEPEKEDSKLAASEETEAEEPKAEEKESEKGDSKLAASEKTETEEPKAEEKEPDKEGSKLLASEETEPEEPKAEDPEPEKEDPELLASEEAEPEEIEPEGIDWQEVDFDETEASESEEVSGDDMLDELLSDAEDKLDEVLSDEEWESDETLQHDLKDDEFFFGDEYELIVLSVEDAEDLDEEFLSVDAEAEVQEGSLEEESSESVSELLKTEPSTEEPKELTDETEGVDSAEKPKGPTDETEGVGSAEESEEPTGEPEGVDSTEKSEDNLEELDEALFGDDTDMAEAQTGEINLEELLQAEAEELLLNEAHAEEVASAAEEEEKPILSPDIQRMIDEIEGVVPTELPKPKKVKKKKDDGPTENMGKIAEALRMDEELEDEEEYWGAGEISDEKEIVTSGGGKMSVADDNMEKDLEFTEEILDDFEDEDEEFLGEAPDLEEEFRINPENSGPDDREIPDDDDTLHYLKESTPLSRMETAKMIATGKTSPIPVDEISDAMSLSDTGFVVHAKYDLEAQSGVGTRAGLTDEQKKLFSYFVPVRGMSEQLVDVLEQDKNCTNREGTSRTGNLLIIGNKGNGKTVLAVDVVKAIQKQRNIKQGKVAIVTGDVLNKKKLSDIFEKLYGGALIIEKAGKLDERTVARLNKMMEEDTGEMLIVLEEQRKPLDRLLSSNREFRKKFTSRLEVPVFVNDELVTFGQTYAQENGYRIDEMGILALYSRIDALQREDHSVSVAEVKDIMDSAIQKSQKASARKFMMRMFRKNTESTELIILSEKDFDI